MGFFVADFGNFENGWEDLWEFHDFGWEFLYFGSNHTELNSGIFLAPVIGTMERMKHINTTD